MVLSPLKVTLGMDCGFPHLNKVRGWTANFPLKGKSGVGV